MPYTNKVYEINKEYSILENTFLAPVTRYNWTFVIRKPTYLNKNYDDYRTSLAVANILV